MEKLDEVRVGTPDGLKISSLEVARFYSENWQRKLAFEIPSFYQWQFRDPPANQGKDLNCVAIDSAGHILGVMGLNQRPFWLAGKLRNGAELTTWVVSPLARGKGVGRAIMNYLQARYDVLSGSGITDDALQIYLTSGFRFLRQHPRFVRVWHLEAIRPHSLIKPLGDKLANLRLKPPAAMQFRAEACSAAHLADLDAAFGDEFNHYQRDADSLEWRYDRHPFFQYKAFRIAPTDGSRGTAGLVFRETEVQGMKILHVMDCLGSILAIPAALSFLESYARDNRIDAADFSCTSPRINRFFVAGGWFSTVDELCFQFTHLFDPPELVTPPTTSITYWSNDESNDLMDQSRFYLTKGDLDLDRPTYRSYERTGRLPDSARH